LDIASETDSFIATAQKIIANDAAAAAYIQQQRADLLNKDT
jgi:hypothetical protein